MSPRTWSSEWPRLARQQAPHFHKHRPSAGAKMLAMASDSFPRVLWLALRSSANPLSAEPQTPRPGYSSRRRVPPAGPSRNCRHRCYLRSSPRGGVLEGLCDPGASSEGAKGQRHGYDIGGHRDVDSPCQVWPCPRGSGPGTSSAAPEDRDMKKGSHTARLPEYWRHFTALGSSWGLTPWMPNLVWHSMTAWVPLAAYGLRPAALSTYREALYGHGFCSLGRGSSGWHLSPSVTGSCDPFADLHVYPGSTCSPVLLNLGGHNAFAGSKNLSQRLPKTILRIRYLHSRFVTVARLQLWSGNTNNFMVRDPHSLRNCIKRPQHLEGWEPLLQNKGRLQKRLKVVP